MQRSSTNEQKSTLEPPARAFMVSATAHSVTVEWDSVKGAKAYVVQLQDDLKEWHRRYWGLGTQALLNNLASNSCYNLRVRAETDSLLGLWKFFKAATSEGPPPSTALFSAISADRSEKVKKIINSRPVLLEALYLNGQRPLTRAVSLGRDRIICTLLQLGADVNACDPSTGRSALMYACHLGNDTCVRILSDAGANWHLRDRIGLTALNHALGANEKVVRLAISEGCDVNQADCNSWTPLMRVVILDSGWQMASILLEEGALPDRKDSLGMTALMHACLLDHGNSYVRLLLKTGKCNPRIENKNGNTAMDLLRGRKDLDTIALILDYLKEDTAQQG